MYNLNVLSVMELVGYVEFIHVGSSKGSQILPCQRFESVLFSECNTINNV